MRNDARPIGEESPASPVGGDSSPIPGAPAGDSESRIPPREADIVNEDGKQKQEDDKS